MTDDRTPQRGPFSDAYALAMGELAATELMTRRREEGDREAASFWRLISEHLHTMQQEQYGLHQ